MANALPKRLRSSAPLSMAYFSTPRCSEEASWPMQQPCALRSTATRRSACAFSGQHHSHGFQHDQQIQEERVVLDVVQVVLQLLDRILDRRAVLVTNLSPARHARFDAVTHGVIRNLADQLIHKELTLRAGADHA